MGSNLIQTAIMNKTGIQMMERVLDLASMRQKIPAANMVNVGTPGSRRLSQQAMDV